MSNLLGLIINKKNITEQTQHEPWPGDFNCYKNPLTSLEFCPKEVGGDFYCSNNKLTSLEFCTEKVCGYFNCSNNKLTSLEFCPRRSVVTFIVLPTSSPRLLTSTSASRRWTGSSMLITTR